eukprot:2658540-Karenia_brevis.AAC.1
MGKPNHRCCSDQCHTAVFGRPARSACTIVDTQQALRFQLQLAKRFVHGGRDTHAASRWAHHW